MVSQSAWTLFFPWNISSTTSHVVFCSSNHLKWLRGFWEIQKMKVFSTSYSKPFWWVTIEANLNWIYLNKRTVRNDLSTQFLLMKDQFEFYIITADLSDQCWYLLWIWSNLSFSLICKFNKLLFMKKKKRFQKIYYFVRLYQLFEHSRLHSNEHWTWIHLWRNSSPNICRCETCLIYIVEFVTEFATQSQKRISNQIKLLKVLRNAARMY